MAKNCSMLFRLAQSGTSWKNILRPRKLYFSKAKIYEGEGF